MSWTIRTTLGWMLGHFEQRGEENPRLAAQMLLARATGLTRLELYLDHDRPLSLEERAWLREAVRRRDAQEPLQYIIGHTHFRRLRLNVRPGVLIPRPETELLAGFAIEELERREQEAAPKASDASSLPLPREQPEPLPLYILDIGTGSGCIALSVLQELRHACAWATDISDEAIIITSENAAELGPGVEARLSLLQDDLATSLLASHAEFFDVIVSNPPYIPTGELECLPVEVSAFEPVQALDGGPDGLSAFRRILAQSAVLLKPCGLLAVELHENYLDDAGGLAAAAGFTDLETRPDLTGRKRFLLARRPKTGASPC